MGGFQYVNDVLAAELIDYYQLAASQSVVPGDALKFSNGKVTPVSAQTDVAMGVARDTATSTATSITTIGVVRANNGLTKFKIFFTPLVNDLAAQSNSTITQSKVALTDGSSSDLVGGYVYCKELNETRLITANTYSSNVVTLTHEAFTRIVTTGDTLRVIGFGPGDAAVKFGSSNPQRNISNVIADLASGKLTVHEVNLAKKFAIVSFNAS